MAELVEDDIMGEDLDYEEYDLDEEEEEALLANNKDEDFLSKPDPIQISVHQDVTMDSNATIMNNSLNYLDEEDDEHLIEEEDDDEYDSTSRDRFKSERTKVSLTEPSKTRNIPDSLDDVKTTEILHENQNRGMSRKQRYNHNRKRKNNQRQMQNHQPGYQNYNNFNSWDSPPLMGMPPQRMLPPSFSPMLNMRHLHVNPINVHSPYGENFLQPPPTNPYMVNPPQIPPQISLKRSFNDTHSNKHPKISRTIDNSAKLKDQLLSPNRPKQSNTNPNLTVINTVEIPRTTVKQPSPKIMPATNNIKAAPTAIVDKNISPEEREYQAKLEEQKKKRAEILAKKEMRRQEAAKKAQLNAPRPVNNFNDTMTKAKAAIKSRAQKVQLLEGFHGKPQISNDSELGHNQRQYPNDRPQLPIHIGQEGSFALRNLVPPPAATTSLNLSLPPPRLALPSQPFRPMRPPTILNRPMETHPYMPPPNRPPPRIRQLSPPREMSFAPRFIPNRPPPLSVSQPIFRSTAPINLPPRGAPTNMPPPMAPRYTLNSQPQITQPPVVQQAPTITLNFPPPPLNRPVMQAQSDFYPERESIQSEPEYSNAGNNVIKCDLPFDYSQRQSQDAQFSPQKYKWKPQRKAPLRYASSESNITIKPAERIQIQPVKKVKKFKRIIRKNKSGEVLLIKKLVLDEDGNPTGVEEVEYMHDDFIAEKVSMKQRIDKMKNVESVQRKTVSISNKHFRGADNVPINKMGEGIKRTTYSKLASSQPVKRIVTNIGKDRIVKPVRGLSHTVMLSKIPSNVTVNELKGLAAADGLDEPKSILYDKAERKCSFEFTDQEVAYKFCKKMNGQMVKMSIILANMV